MATTAQAKKWIETIAPITQELAPKNADGRYKIYPSVCIAQSCCESGYGTSQKMIKANAVFGIKVGKSKAHFGKYWKDKAYSTKTKECYDGKTYLSITDLFRAYDSIYDAVGDYYDMLSNSSRYKYCLNTSSPKDCITGIQKAPYATDPYYVRAIMNIINKWNLTQYDGSDSNAYSVPAYTLKKGDVGDGVRWLQYSLVKLGYSVSIDGIFGKDTEKAVRRLQNEAALTVDGIVGKKTKAIITSLV